MHHDLDIRDRDAIVALVRRYGNDVAARRACRRAAVARLGRARAVRRLRHQRRRNAQPSRGRSAPRRGGDVHLHVDEQGVRGHAQRAPPPRAGDALGDRPGAHVLERHSRGHVDRRVAPQPLRGVEGRRGRPRPGVRTLFRAPNGVLPWRNADRPAPLGHGAARLSRVHHALRDDRGRLHGLRLQGKAGPRRDPQPRPDPRLRRVLQAAALRRGLQHRRGPVQQRVRPRGDRARPGDQRRGARLDVRRDQPRRRPPLVDRGQRPLRRRTTPTWKLEYDVRRILEEIRDSNRERWRPSTESLSRPA